MKSKRPGSPRKAKTGAAKAAASKPPPAAKPRKKALSAAIGSATVAKRKAAPAPKAAPARGRATLQRSHAPDAPPAETAAQRQLRPTGKANPKSEIRNPQSGLEKQKAESRKQKSKIENPQSAIRNPQSSHAPTESRPAGRKESPKPASVPIPPILLEGDDAAPAPASGPGRRYVLGPAPQPLHPAPAGAELPESYGTGQLLLAARDPRWLYAHWDFAAAQLKEYNALSADGHLVLRLYRDAPAGQPLLQVHLHPESRHWFVPAPYAGAKYAATLGYYDAAKNWTELARSAATLTPPDWVAEDTAVRFATIPADVPFAQLMATVQAAVRENVPLAEAVLQLRAEGFSSLPEPEQIAGPWTAAQEAALAEVVLLDPAHRVWVGSLEVTELIRRQLERAVSSIGAAQLGLPFSPAAEAAALGGVSSPSAGPERGRGFWFNVNAELIVYGSTEPDAAVSIAGRQFQLRRDGSFSFRFALPDGQYELPVAARSPDGVETREAELKFSRASRYHGAVEAHPQDDKLQPPLPGVLA